MSRTHIMGIVNATPDSFSDGGMFADAMAAVDHALMLVDEGADILDIGGESTRPGATAISVEEELRRVVPIIEALAQQTPAKISIDTRKPEVARACIAAGASIWNDVSALSFSADSVETAAQLGCDVVLMHAQGDPKTMQDDPQYDDVIEEVYNFLDGRKNAAIAAGVCAARIFVDPGIGFGKTLHHNIALLASLGRFKQLGPVLLGASRKRFIAAIDRDGPAHGRLGGSIAAALIAAGQNVDIVRVHDVAETRQALALHRAIGKVG